MNINEAELLANRLIQEHVECKAIYKYRAFCPHCNDYHYRNKLVKRPLWCIKSKGFLPDEQLVWEEGQFVE